MCIIGLIPVFSQNKPIGADTADLSRQIRKATYLIQTENDSALHFTLQVLKQSQAVSYHKGIMDASNILGFIYTQKQDWITPIEREKLARMFAASLIDNKLLSDILLNTAEDYYQYNEKKKAVQTLQFAIQIADYDNNPSAEVKALTRKAEILYELGDFSNGQADYQNALQKAHQLNDSLLISKIHYSRGNVALLQGKHEQSVGDFEISLKYLSSDLNLIALYCQLGLAQNYIEQDKHYKAEKYIHLAGQNIVKDTSLEASIRYAALLANYYEKLDKVQSISYYKRCIQLTDSLNQIKHINYVNTLRYAFNSQRTEKQIESISEQVEVERIKRRTFFIVVLILSVMVTLIIVGIRKRNRILKRENEVAHEKIRLEQERMKNLEERNLIDQQRNENRKQMELIEHEKLRQILERAELERRELAIELDEKHRVLLTNTMQNEQYNDFLNEILAEIREFPYISDKRQFNKLVLQLVSNIQSRLAQAEDWEKVKVYFDKVHPDFFEKLKTDFPDLTVNELKFCAYTKMKLNGKEISRLLNINPGSVQVSRYRLKRKMGLPEEVSFSDYVLQNY